MPYVDRFSREDLDPTAYLLHNPRTAGELTFQLTQVVLRYLGDDPSFSNYAAAVAALECSKLELYRRSVAPHEDRAIERNGDLAYPGSDRG